MTFESKYEGLRWVREIFDYGHQVRIAVGIMKGEDPVLRNAVMVLAAPYEVIEKAVFGPKERVYINDLNDLLKVPDCKRKVDDEDYDEDRDPDTYDHARLDTVYFDTDVQKFYYELPRKLLKPAVKKPISPEAMEITAKEKLEQWLDAVREAGEILAKSQKHESPR